MPKKKPQTVCTWKSILLLFGLMFLSCNPISAQTARPLNQDERANPRPGVEEYKIGPDDVLLVTVADALEFGGKFRVNDGGLIEIPGISSPIHAEGLSALELSHEIRKTLLEAKQLRDPRVSVFVEEYHGSTISVLGAVNKPAVYSLQKRTTVLKALSMASGTLPNAGSTVTIVRGRASAEATGTPVGSVQIIDMGRLVKGEDSAANVEVRNEDVLSVSAAQVVYVVGAVTKPGGFTMSNPSEGISVVQAIALAEGFRSVAATHRAVIVRQSTNEQARREIPVDLAQMMTGKETDLLLAPNDILFVPESGGKKTLKVMGDIAMAAVNGVAIYGLGYRIGTHQ
ncbi:MAG TPA: polysaccharide biosynthesis/export family protein [Candidatus Acidoferrum sp.]|nr:polysaccharide biosynthesis/export family protein [Candidatus Acidoferrum sp.]